MITNMGEKVVLIIFKKVSLIHKQIKVYDDNHYYDAIAVLMMILR